MWNKQLSYDMIIHHKKLLKPEPWNPSIINFQALVLALEQMFSHDWRDGDPN